MAETILLVEDEEKLARMVELYKENHMVVVTFFLCRGVGERVDDPFQ